MAEALIDVEIEFLDSGAVLVTSPDVPGLVAEGRTVAEALEIAQDVARKIAEACLEHGDPLPPKLKQAATPRAVARIPVSLP